MVKYYREIHQDAYWHCCYLWGFSGRNSPAFEKEMPMSLGFVPKALIRAAMTRLHICRKPLPLVLCLPFGLDTGLLCALNVPIFQLLLQAK